MAVKGRFWWDARRFVSDICAKEKIRVLNLFGGCLDVSFFFCFDNIATFYSNGSSSPSGFVRVCYQFNNPNSIMKHFRVLRFKISLVKSRPCLDVLSSESQFAGCAEFTWTPGIKKAVPPVNNVSDYAYRLSLRSVEKGGSRRTCAPGAATTCLYPSYLTSANGFSANFKLISSIF